jgi:hypothetical protein
LTVLPCFSIIRSGSRSFVQTENLVDERIRQ